MREDAADPVERLTAFFAAGPRPASALVVTGAGISLASGIPTFRGTDEGAIWSNDVTTLGTLGYFEADPVGSWRWYLSRFDGVLKAEPNPAHEALVAIERRLVDRGDGFLLVTQNVDTLHERAGSRRLAKVHGSADRVRCSRQGCESGAPRGSLPRAAFDAGRFLSDPRPETLPRCPACDALLRQHVLWFDEVYSSHADYRYEEVVRAAWAADRVLFVGTSFSVGVTDMVLRCALARGAPVLAIDPGEAPLPRAVVRVRAKAEDVLPAVARATDAR
jgi:NAD-dependent deacetylase